MGKNRHAKPDVNPASPPGGLKVTLLSSLPGLLVALLGAVLQVSIQRGATQSDRRIAALRDYSAACYRHAAYMNTMYRMTRFSLLLADPKTPPESKASIEEALKEVKKYQEEGTASVAGLLTARDMVNTMFDDHVDPFQGIGATLDISGWKDWDSTAALAPHGQEFLKAQEVNLNRMLANCRVTAERLGTKTK